MPRRFIKRQPVRGRRPCAGLRLTLAERLSSVYDAPAPGPAGVARLLQVSAPALAEVAGHECDQALFRRSQTTHVAKGVRCQCAER